MIRPSLPARRGPVALTCLTALSVAFALWLAGPPAQAKTEKPVKAAKSAPAPAVAAPAAAEPAAEAAAAIVAALRTNKGPVRVGMPAPEAVKAVPSAAQYMNEWFLPLKGSWLDPKGTREGVVQWDAVLSDGKTVDLVRVVLLTGPYDREAVRQAIVKAARTVGLKLERDDEDPDLWFDPEASGVELWIALGDGLILLEANTP